MIKVDLFNTLLSSSQQEKEMTTDTLHHHRQNYRRRFIQPNVWSGGSKVRSRSRTHWKRGKRPCGISLSEKHISRNISLFVVRLRAGSIPSARIRSPPRSTRPKHKQIGRRLTWPQRRGTRLFYFTFRLLMSFWKMKPQSHFHHHSVPLMVFFQQGLNYVSKKEKKFFTD